MPEHTRRLFLWTALLVAVALAGGSPASASPSDCSAEAATPLIQSPSPGENQRLVDRVYCGAFLGPGSQAMLVVIRSQGGPVLSPPLGGLAGIGAWEMFGLVAGAWTASTDGAHFAPDGLLVAGSVITEQRATHRRGDWAAGAPTGGWQARDWTWDGASGLAATGWRQLVPPEADGVVLRAPRDPRAVAVTFRVARQPILCSIQDGRRTAAHCEYRRSRIATVTMNVRGRLRTCRARPHRYGCGIGDPGEGDLTNTLHSGQTVMIGRFGCRAGQGGVRCTVLRSGKGFLLDRHGAHRVG